MHDSLPAEETGCENSVCCDITKTLERMRFDFTAVICAGQSSLWEDSTLGDGSFESEEGYIARRTTYPNIHLTNKNRDKILCKAVFHIAVLRIRMQAHLLQMISQIVAFYTHPW